MKHKSRMRVLECKYFVSEDQKTVACVLDCTLQLNKHPQSDMITDSVMIDSILDKFPELKDWRGNFRVRATAKCSPEDTFNEVLGRRISESKAKAKAFKFTMKVYKYILEKFLHATSDVINTIEACQVAYEVEEEHLGKLKEETCV